MNRPNEKRAWPSARADDPDATVLIRRRKSRPAWPLAAAVAVIISLGGASAWLAWRPAQVAVSQADLPRADEAGILGAAVPRTTLVRFAPAPVIVVALFPTLHDQALTLNRIAIFLEYAAAPRDRVLNDTELQATIATAHESFDDFYDGHDYRAADLARFFATADADGIVLNDAEKRLRTSLDELRASPPGIGALISLPGPGAIGMDERARAVILRHELSHGLYFTDPAYAAMVTSFWQTVVTPTQRASIRRFLGSGGYDEANDDLMRNEAQAYLIHTRDPRFFAPALAGLSEQEAATLRANFVAMMPAGWLRDRTAP
jgi:hypothetical protein